MKNMNIYWLKPLQSVRDRRPLTDKIGHPVEEQNTPDNPEHNPWSPWYDKAFGFIVSAPSEEDARLLASLSAGDEKFVEYGEDADGECVVLREHNPWLDPAYTSCEVAGTDCPYDAQVILRDFASA